MLVRRAHARQAAWHDLAALGHELSQQPVVLVVDVFNLLDAELANLLAPEELAPAGAALARSARSTAAAKSRTISARPSAFTPRRPLARRRLLWCFRLVCNCNSPQSVASDQWSVAGQKNLVHTAGLVTDHWPLTTRLYALAGASAAGAAVPSSAAAAGCALTFFLASRSALIFASRFCSSSTRTVKNLITGSVTRRRRSSS